MSEQIRIILIIIVSVSIFGLIIFVIVKNFIKSKIDYYLEEKNKKTKKDEYFFHTLLWKDP